MAAMQTITVTSFSPLTSINRSLGRTKGNRVSTKVSAEKSSTSPLFSSPSSNSSNPAIAAADTLFQVFQSGATRVQRAFTPPPPGFPPGPSGDVALDLLKDPLAFLIQTQRKFGDVVGLSLGGERAVLVTDPLAAKTVLTEAPEIYIKEGTAFFPGSSLAGNGLLVSDGDVWRRQRQLSTPAFRRAAIEKYATSMIDCTCETLLTKSRWRPGAVRDVYADFNELTLRITLSALFGGSEDLSSSAAKEVTDSIQQAFEFFSRRSATAFIIPESVPTPDNLQFTAAVARLDRAVYGLIARRRKELEESSSNNFNGDDNNDDDDENTKGDIRRVQKRRDDLLTSLLLSKDENGVGMDDISLRDELMTLLVAGQETSAILLGSACAMLANAPEIQNKAAEEVQKVLQGGRKPVPQEDIGKLQYIEAVVLEAMRVMPPAYLVGRCTASSTSLVGYNIPKGTTILVSPFILHRDPRWWSSDSYMHGADVAEFNPERWLNMNNDSNYTNNDNDTSNASSTSNSPPNPKINKSLATTALAGMGVNGAYIPFGAGQRVCIGTGFAMLEAILVLALILQKFELVKLPGSKDGLPEAEPRITLRPKQVRLILRQRKRKKE
jgi:cytochrome P450